MKGEALLKTNQLGAATVEFALTATVFLAVLFTLIDFAYLFWGNLSMAHAVREGARYAVTGQSGLDPTPQGTAQDRCDAAVEAIKNQSMGFYAMVSPVVTFKTVNNDGSITVVACSASNQITVISIANTLPLLTPFLKPFFTNGNYTFTVSATMKNEGF